MLYRKLTIFLVLFSLTAKTISVFAEDTGSSTSDTSGTGTTGEGNTKVTSDSTPIEDPADAFDAKDHQDWGTYYDPKNIFCGQYDCYKILGFDYESYGREKPSTKTITKRYRALSREWHPDKSKHKDAKERFVKIARAYEVLTDIQQRKEYDFMRYNQEAYFQKYGASVLFKYAPKTDTVIVILVLLVAMNAFSWFAQKQRWQQVANRLIQATVEDWSPNQGGTTESKLLREQALAKLAEMDAKSDEVEKKEANSTLKSKKAASNKLSAKEKKKQEQDRLRPIVTELVEEMHDFGAGFHKPTWKDLLIVKMSHWPYYITVGTIWQTKYYVRRLQGLELNDEERQVLSERAVGPVAWELASDDDKNEMIKRELWILNNLVEWKEEQEVKTWSKADQKMYAKMKKSSFKDD